MATTTSATPAHASTSAHPGPLRLPKSLIPMMRAAIAPIGPMTAEARRAQLGILFAARLRNDLLTARRTMGRERNQSR